MKYFSLREYFYKINSTLLAIILLPLLALAVVYYLMQQQRLEGPLRTQEDLHGVLFLIGCFLIVSEWAMSTLLFFNRLKQLRKIPSLGERLDGYYTITLIRFSIVTSLSLFLVVGFFLTEDQRYTLAAVINILVLMLLWPRPVKLCNDLELKGDERMLVQYKMDQL